MSINVVFTCDSEDCDQSLTVPVDARLRPLYERTGGVQGAPFGFKQSLFLDRPKRTLCPNCWQAEYIEWTAEGHRLIA